MYEDPWAVPTTAANTAVARVPRRVYPSARDPHAVALKVDTTKYTGKLTLRANGRAHVIAAGGVVELDRTALHGRADGYSVSGDVAITEGDVHVYEQLGGL